MRRPGAIIAALWALAAGSVALCQVYQTSFEEGDKNPKGWTPAYGVCAWEEGTAHTGKRCISLTGNGEDSGVWEGKDMSFTPGQVYRLTFYYRSKSETAGKGGCFTPGATFAYTDYPHSEDWRQGDLIFMAPHKPLGYSLRMSHWRFPGTGYFDDVRMEPVCLSFLRREGIVLSKDEKIEKGAYTFKSDWSGPYRAYSRVIQELFVGYHTGNFEFRKDRFMVLLFQVGDLKQTSARVKFGIRHFVQGAGVIEAGADKTNWRLLERVTAEGERAYDLPPEIFPANKVFIRLSVEGDAIWDLNSMEYTAKLEGTPPDLVGASHWFCGKRVSVDTGRVQLVFQEGRPDLVELQCGGKSLGSLRCVTAQFEKAGLGYKRTGIGLAEATRVTKIELKQQEAQQCAVEVTAEREESVETQRRFEAVYRFEAVAGQNWVRCRLVSVKNTDGIEYQLKGYVHLLQPSVEASAQLFNFEGCGGWVQPDGVLGALSETPPGFTFGLRREGDRARGEVSRGVQAQLSPGYSWAAGESALVLFAAKGNDRRAVFQEAQQVRALLGKPVGEVASGAIACQEEREERAPAEKKP